MVARPWSSSHLSCGERLLLNATGTPGILSRPRREKIPALEIGGGNGLFWMWAELSCFHSGGDGYVGELLELQQRCEESFLAAQFESISSLVLSFSLRSNAHIMGCQCPATILIIPSFSFLIHTFPSLLKFPKPPLSRPGAQHAAFLPSKITPLLIFRLPLRHLPRGTTKCLLFPLTPFGILASC